MAKKIAPVHPGTVLKLDFMDELGLSANALARAIGVPSNRITQLVAGRRQMTADTALRLEKAFGVGAIFWTGLQADFDLRTARDAGEYDAIDPVDRAAA